MENIQEQPQGAQADGHSESAAAESSTSMPDLLELQQVVASFQELASGRERLARASLVAKLAVDLSAHRQQNPKLLLAEAAALLDEAAKY